MGTWTVGDPTWEKQGTGGGLLAQVAQTKSCWSSVGRSERWESSRGEGDIPRAPAARGSLETGSWWQRWWQCGESRMLMSVLIGSDSRSLSRLCGGIVRFSVLFLLFIVAQEGAVVPMVLF